jgi:hypothetical protein
MNDTVKRRRVDSSNSINQDNLDTNDDWVGPKHNEVDNIQENENNQTENDNRKETDQKKRKSIRLSIILFI